MLFQPLLILFPCVWYGQALVAEGKVQYVGLSEVTADDIRRAHAITPISAVELEWSLFTRDVEVSTGICDMGRWT